jgi:hypothetical protein
MSNDFYGLPTQTIGNHHLQLEFLADAGPRIVRLSLAGARENLFAELPRKKIETPHGDYFLRGGHRLWHSPEAMPRTYLPDNAGVTIQPVEGGVRLWQPTEALTGITKNIELRLDPKRAVATITHRLLNDGAETVEFAPWAITMLPLGGTAILPQTVGAIDEAGLLPNRNLVVWPYTRIADARLELGDDLIQIQAHAALPALKIGCMNRHGWLAYLRNGTLFVKRFKPQPDRAHPDFDCNTEIYCNDEFIELETLGPLTRLQPGQSVSHVETWEVYSGVTDQSLVDKLVTE